MAFAPELDNPGNIALEGVGPLNLGHAWHERFLKTLIDWSACPKNYAVHICDAVQFVDVTTIVKSDMNDLDTKAVNYLPCFALDNSEDVYRENPLSDQACMIVDACRVEVIRVNPCLVMTVKNRVSRPLC